MSNPRHDEESHSHHWSGDHSEGLIKVEGDVIHISAKAMNIVWGGDPRFWRWVELSKEESCFGFGAELIQVNYLEVTGSLDLSKFTLSPLRTYEILYIVKFKVDAFGWDKTPVKFEVFSPDHTKSKKIKALEELAEMSNELREIDGGHFCPTTKSGDAVAFRMCEVETGWWKGGMILEGVKIRPKSN